MKTPREIAQERMDMSEEYSRFSGELAQHIKKRAEHYVANRENYKSDTAVERAWDLTEDGQKMEIIKLKLKALEKQMSAHKTMLETLTEEARGNY